MLSVHLSAHKEFGESLVFRAMPPEAGDKETQLWIELVTADREGRGSVTLFLDIKDALVLARVCNSLAAQLMAARQLSEEVQA